VSATPWRALSGRSLAWRHSSSGRIGRRVEAELLAITGAMTAGLQDEAAERAERLTERLDHPSARLSS
jgi:hypothetical protein